MTNEILDNLEKDLELLKMDKFHPKHDDLKNIVFGEDIPELIAFAKRTIKALDYDPIPGTNDYMKGYLDSLHDLKREIYGT